jgi:hypothetical protein
MKLKIMYENEFTIGFLFNNRIFPHANDCRVRCNSPSSKNRKDICANRKKMTNEF